MKYIFYKDNTDIFWIKWNEFMANFPCSVSYTKNFLEYIEFILIERGELIQNLSFVLIDREEVVGIAFLPLIKVDNSLQIYFSGYNGFVFAPLSKNKKYEMYVFEMIDKLAMENKIDKINFLLDPLVQNYTFNNLLKYRYFNVSTTDCIVDLSLNKKELWKNLRKSYKALINKILKDKNFSIIIMNKDNKDYNIHELYRLLHKKAAGKETRPKQSFDYQYKLLENNNAILISLLYKDKFIGMNYFYFNNKNVIYASGANDPDFNHIPIHHVILWKAIEYFANENYNILQFSQPCGYGEIQGFNDYYDKKQLNISYFKRGMGAKPIILHRGSKYYNKDLFECDIKRMLDAI